MLGDLETSYFRHDEENAERPDSQICGGGSMTKMTNIKARKNGRNHQQNYNTIK